MNATIEINTVKDCDNDRFQLVESPDDVRKLNERFREDYNYYFIEYNHDYDYPINIYGSQTCMLTDFVYLIDQYF